MKTTEEDIKIKVVIPFLKSLGFDERELSFESNFSIRLGKYSHHIGRHTRTNTAHGRLDILVKKNGINLFIVEVKSDSHSLTDDDKEQAISYARLVHPMAPIVITTNGKDFKLYNVSNKKEIQERYRNGLLQIDIDKDLQFIYEEAIQYFLGYSFENVKLFCSAQIDEGMKTLLGSIQKPDRKFIPELYVPSQKIAKAVRAFLCTDKPVFALIGESGGGKTCSMCGLALELSQDYAVLFYRAIEFTDGVTKSIANDFEWQFSPHFDEITFFKRLTSIFKTGKLIIFLDAVDEWMHPDKVEILGKFASNIRARNIKLIISCKSGHWDRFLTSRGIPTSLSEEIFVVDDKFQGYLMEPFDDEEYHNLIRKYREFFLYEGAIEGEVYQQCKKLPFLLRVIFQVGHKVQANCLSFSLREFFEEYYNQVLNRIPYEHKTAAEQATYTVARLLFENNTDMINANELSEKMATQFVPDTLFECNILEKTGDGFDKYIGFYFQKLRDYIIAFGVNRWERKSVNEFRQDYKAIENGLNNVRLDVVRLFYQLTAVEKQRVIDEPVRVNAQSYLDFYCKVLDHDFASIRHRFRPKTNGRIGFVGDIRFPRVTIDAYGFRPVGQTDEPVLLIPLERSFWGQRDEVPLPMRGGMHYRGSCNGFRSINIRKEVLEFEIVEQLMQIIEKGLLNESSNYYLALEKALGIIVNTQAEMHDIRDKDRVSKYLPISIDRVEYSIRYQKGLKHFENELFEEKKRQGKVKVIRSGSIYTTSPYSYTPQEREKISRQAHESASSKTALNSRVRYVDLETIHETLTSALDTIKNRKSVIDETILPDRDNFCSQTGFVQDCFKIETLISFAQRLFTLFLLEYKAIIETNFPTLKNWFRLYSVMPLHCFLVVGGARNEYTIRIFECKHDGEKDNEVTLCSMEDISCDRDDRWLLYKGKRYRILQERWEGLGSSLMTMHNFINVSIPWEFTVLRNKVYCAINSEIPIVLDELRRRYINP